MEVVINDCIVEINELPDIISFKNKTYQEIVNLKEELKEKQEVLDKVEKYLYANCNHQWVTDSIDSIHSCVSIASMSLFGSSDIIT